MEEPGLYDCPMPETFRDKAGMLVFLAWLFYLGFVARMLFAPLMPAIEVELGISHSDAGLLFLMMSSGYLLAPLCSGMISSRIEHLGTLKLSAWLTGLALLPFSFITSKEGTGLLLLVVGFAGSLHLPSAIATITAEIQRSDWGKGLSVHQLAPPLSFVSAPLIAAILLQWFNWRTILLIWSGLALATACLYTLKGKGGAFPGKAINLQNTKEVGSNPSFWLMVLLFAMAVGGNAGIFAMLPLFFVNERGFDLTLANILIGLSQLSGIVFVFLAGWLTDRVGQKAVMAATLSVTAVLTILLAVVKGKMLVVILFLQPAVLSAFFPAGFAAISRTAPPALRSVTNSLGPPLSFLLGGGLMPVVIGYMAESYSFSSGILFAGCFMLAGPLCVFFLRLGESDELEGC
jgi:NNP family nitrate/nitrite transporter-like MFS transporter